MRTLGGVATRAWSWLGTPSGLSLKDGEEDGEDRKEGAGRLSWDPRSVCVCEADGQGLRSSEGWVSHFPVLEPASPVRSALQPGGSLGAGATS